MCVKVVVVLLGPLESIRCNNSNTRWCLCIGLFRLMLCDGAQSGSVRLLFLIPEVFLHFPTLPVTRAAFSSADPAACVGCFISIYHQPASVMLPHLDVSRNNHSILPLRSPPVSLELRCLAHENLRCVCYNRRYMKGGKRSTSPDCSSPTHSRLVSCGKEKQYNKR